MKETARQIALNVLLKIFKNNAYSNLALDAALKKTRLDVREKAFASALVYGTCERLVTLDYTLEKYLSKPLGKLEPQVLAIMRLGAYQLLFMSGVPASAAVNESVNLAKSNGCAYASGLINAVLRKIAKNGLQLPNEEDKIKYLSIKFSCPQWLIEKWLGEYGEEKTESILTYSIKENKITIRVNTVKISQNELADSLSKSGVLCERTNVENALIIGELPCSVEELDEFKNGLFHVQGIPSQLCAKAVVPQEGDTVFDLCAAPGGKTFTMAQLMKNKGTVKAFDLYESRALLIAKGAKRLGLDIVTSAPADASVFDEKLGKADCVLCDVPCSGLGIISKKPEIKFKNPKELSSLPDIQLKILETGAKYVKNGGRLVYSTCTLSREENEKVCERFLEKNKDFKKAKPFSKISNDYFVTVFPNQTNSDGFFIALFEKEG